MVNLLEKENPGCYDKPNKPFGGTQKKSRERFYWTEAIVFTTSNNSFGSTEISYLENRFCNLALTANRSLVKNGNDPTPGNITEEKESEMEEFIHYAKVIMGTLGHKVFESKTKISVKEEDNAKENVELFLYLKHLKRTIKNLGTVEAVGKQATERFVVFKGSHISSADDDTAPAVIRDRRLKAIVEEDYILQDDVLLTSPSYVAMFVIGKRANGLITWKTKDGKTLKSLENEG